jgi:hypothetical protein
MKKILFFTVVAVLSIVGGYKGAEKIDSYILENRIERMNKHIQYLHDEEGYSWEAARKIGATEAGFIPQDDQYLMLIED